MAENHLQLHGQYRSNGKVAGSRNRGSGGSGGSGGLDLKEIVTEKNSQGKELSNQRIQHSQLHTNFMASFLDWP